MSVDFKRLVFSLVVFIFSLSFVAEYFTTYKLLHSILVALGMIGFVVGLVVFVVLILWLSTVIFRD